MSDYNEAINSIVETMPLKYYKSIEDEKSLHITDNSIVETMPRKCYEHVHARNSLHITDLGIKYLAKSIRTAHFQADDCMCLKKDYYIKQAKELEQRIVFNEQKNCPELIKSDLGMSDLETKGQNFDLFFSDCSQVTEVNVVKPKNPMLNARTDE